MKTKKKIKILMLLIALGIFTMFFINISIAVDFAKINVETANLRESKDSNSKILKQLSLNQEVEILNKDGDWYKVNANGISGYIRQDLITIKEQNKNVVPDAEKQEVKEEVKPEVNKTDAKKQVIEDTKLKIVPSINATDIIEVKKDEIVKVIETINNWVCIQTDTTKGWIYKEKIKDIEEQKPIEPKEEKTSKIKFVNKEVVNLRKDADINADVVEELKLNDEVEVYSDEKGWSKVKAKGKEGYIASTLLSDKKKEVATSRNSNETRQPKKDEKNSEVDLKKGSTVVETAKKYLNCKYKRGAIGPKEFDCSGFTNYIYKLHGVNLNRTAKAQYQNGSSVDRNNLQQGDLIMFGSSKENIDHVAIYIGGGNIIHASTPKDGVKIDTITKGYYNKKYVGARRVI